MAIEDKNTATQNNGNGGNNNNGNAQYGYSNNIQSDIKTDAEFQKYKTNETRKTEDALAGSKEYAWQSAGLNPNNPKKQQTPEVQTTDSAPNGRDMAISYFQQKLNESAPPTAEDLKKERRRRRTEMAIAGMSDMARAISNLVFTAKGAPNMYDPSADMSPKYKEKWDKIKAEREQRNKEREGYELRYIEQLLAKDADELKQEQTDYENRLRQIRLDNDSKKTELLTLRTNNIIDKAEYEKELKKADDERKERESAARTAYYNARTRRLQNTPIRGVGGSKGRTATKNSDGTITLVEEVNGGSLLSPEKQRVTRKFKTEEELQEYLKKKAAEEKGDDYKIPGAK